MMQLKLAEKFLRKADQDMLVLKKWRSDPEISDEILGFHAQQAAEKMLKAVLASRSTDFPFTHRLADLIDTIIENGVAVPEELEEVRYLTPFAVEFRYDIYEEDNEAFDFDGVYILLTKLRKWAKMVIY